MKKILFSLIIVGFLGFVNLETTLTFPQFYFVKNSTEYNEKEIMLRNDFENRKQNSDSVLLYIIELLKVRESLVIEIMGHASFDELTPQEISLIRAEKVEADLISLGVDSSRVEVVGFGDKRLIVELYYFQEFTSEEKVAAHNVNRRVSFRVLR